MTHRNAYPKYKIETIWTPPKNFISDIVFRVTVVQSKNIFWTAIDSDMIEISPGPLVTYNPNGINAFNIHNHNSPQISGGYVLNKDKDHSLYNPHNPSIALSSSAITPPSPFLTVSHQPLVQNYQLSKHDSGTNQDLIYYLDYNVCSRKLCFGLPNGCLRKRNCILLLTGTYIPYTDSTIEFEIIADHRSAMNKRSISFDRSLSSLTTSAYYSMAFSHDKAMGN